MDAKEESKKSLLGKIIGGVIALVVLLLLIVWREALSGVWTRAETAASKRLLEALLGLAAITIVILVAYLLGKRSRKPVAPLEPTMLLIFGLLWDDQQHPHCPVDKAPLFISGHKTESRSGAYDMLRCPKCKQEYPIRSAYFGLMTLHHAINSIRDHLRRGIIELL